MTRPPASSNTVVVAGVVVAFCFVVAAVVVITIAVPEGGNAGSLVAILLGSFAALVPGLLGLAKINDVSRTVEHQANGGGQAKMEAAVRTVLAEQPTSAPGTPPDDTSKSNSPATDQ